MDGYILVLGGTDDLQLKHVVEVAVARGLDVLVLDHDQPRPFAVGLCDSRPPRFEVEGVAYGAPGVVWCRLKIQTVPSHWSSETAVSYYLRGSEWRAMLSGLASLYEDVTLATYFSVMRAESKLLQLSVASQVGFRVPNSQFCLGKTETSDFLRGQARTLAKPISIRNLPMLAGNPDKYSILLTMDVDPGAIEAAPDEEFVGCPMFLQERLLSGDEYRVLAFSDKIFSYKVRGRIEDRVRADERPFLAHLYARAELPAYVQRLTSEYLRRMGLVYGAFDLILDDNGAVHFLECNPEGQWAAANDINFDEVASHFVDFLQAKLLCRAPAAVPVTG